MTKLKLSLALACALAAPIAGAATITVVNNDSPGEGFNDPAPRVPSVSNPGTTLGAQRLFVFQTAANQWGAILTSPVEIKVRAAFNPLTCSGSSAVLGSAGATSAFQNFANAPRLNHSYNVALANSLAGTDLNGTAVGSEEINSQFNSDIDNGVCLTGTTGWSYTTNSVTDPFPAGTVPLLPVVFHELGHGLGFQTFVTTASGALFNGAPDQWTQYLFDTATVKGWSSMTNAERQTSAINDPNLVWRGPNVTADQFTFLGAAPKLIVTVPAAIAGQYDPQQASFGPIPGPSGISGDLVLVNDGVASTSLNDGCEFPFVNAAAMVGKIAVIERGTCNFTVKVKNAQLSGAIGAVIYNNTTGLPGMGGADPTVTIASYGVTQALGDAIKAQLALPATVTATLGYDNTGALAGQRGGYVRMFAPNPLQQGSSVSHFHSEATPNLLMEPALNTSIFSNVDMTLSLFRDIGWKETGAKYNYIFRGDYEELP